MEFAAIDYKMEICELEITTPASNSSRLPFTLSHGEVIVDIWSLDSPGHRLDMAQLSWNTRPKRRNKIASIHLTSDFTFTHRFACPLNSIWIFEMAAAESKTVVEWVQDHDSPNPGERSATSNC